MGSSGVLGYCGLRWFKLIVSRRYDRETPWGFTLVRKRPGGGMPVAEYFVLPNGSIPSFDDDAVFPFKRGDSKTYDKVMLKSGTVIKLYDYQVGRKFSGFRGSREALNENMVETILPFRILDFRWTPDPKRGGYRAEGIDARSFNGMEYLLLRSHRDEDKEEDGEDNTVGTGRLHVGTVKHPQLGEITITAIPLKRKLPGWLNGSINRVFHAVNGQVQYKQTRGYLTTCGVPALKDRAVIVVDASNLSFEAHNEVWKGDREHVRETIVGELYKDEVSKAITQSEELKRLQHQVAQEELQQAARTERNELFQKLVNADRNLAALLTNRDPVIVLPSAGGGKNGDDSGGESEFEGEYSPTYLRIEEKTKAAGLSLPINRSRPIAAKTNAENGYLQRADNRGRFIVNDEAASRFGVRVQLQDGRLIVYLAPKEGEIEVGDEFTLKVGLQDDAMALPVEDEIVVRIVEEEKPTAKHPKKKGERKTGDTGDKEGEGKPQPTHGLPSYRLITRDGRRIGDQETLIWPEGFNENDGGTIEDLGDAGMLYKINYDNAYHLKYRMSARGDVSRDVITEKYVLGMRILMLGYEHALREIRKAKAVSEGFDEFVDEFRRMSARGSAATVLALAENLPKIVDKSALEQNQDVE